MKRWSLFLAALALAAGAHAQSPHGPAQAGPPGPPRIDFAAQLGISPDRAAQVESILQAERERMRAVRAQTRVQLTQVLSAEQLGKLDALLPQPPRPREPRPGAY
jgi:Spy/CpxP family protein refolding chaperone